MKVRPFPAFVLLTLFIFGACSPSRPMEEHPGREKHADTPFSQKYSVKYRVESSEGLSSVMADRNENIQILAASSILRPFNGAFLYPGKLVEDHSYRPMDRMNIQAMDTWQGQFVYLSDQAVFSNSWGGAIYILHGMPQASLLCVGRDIEFIISDGKKINYFKNRKTVLQESVDGLVRDIKFQPEAGVFWILSDEALYRLDPENAALEIAFEVQGLTAFAYLGNQLFVANREGYFPIDPGSGKAASAVISALPAAPITYMAGIDSTLWFGSAMGAFSLREDGNYDYYQGQRWLPGNEVLHISPGPGHSILILTPEGLGQIVTREMTLADKAAYYEEQVRKRHIRYGFNATWSGMVEGDLSTGSLEDSDNDGLWTSMYLGGQAFRYAVTGADEALSNCRESMLALQRLFSINPVKGFPSRSFERRGEIENLADPDRWQHAPDPQWDWKATTSSDEAIGHIFAYAVVADLVDDDELKDLAISLIDSLMTHVVDNDLYLIDYDGKHTTWGRWNPEYVNARPEMVGDRKLNSSNIIAMLQTAYHFTQKEKYKDKAFELMDGHGYLENLLRPISEIGPAPESADDWSKMLSESWNHSDDEMYFMGYWGLYHYAFNDSLKALYKEAIIDHWEAERPEKEGAWNIFTAITGVEHFDLEEAVWYLQEFPLDLITWDVQNSHRKDITILEDNFRQQSTAEVLPPGERPIQRHNGNTFTLDRKRGNGRSEYSAGDIWLLPYWMGRYLNIIGSAEKPGQ